MHPAALNISYKHNPLAEIIIIIINYTRKIILPMVVTIFASHVCSAPLFELLEKFA